MRLTVVVALLAWFIKILTQPVTNNQQPRTNNQQPRTNNQQPRTKNQQPRTDQPTQLTNRLN